MFLTTSEAARISGCSADNIRRLERTGKLKAEKTPSGRRIFRLDEVEKLAQERTKAKEERQQVKTAA